MDKEVYTVKQTAVDSLKIINDFYLNQNVEKEKKARLALDFLCSFSTIKEVQTLTEELKKY